MGWLSIVVGCCVALVAFGCGESTEPDEDDFGEHPQQMRQFVQDLSAYAKGLRPGFLIVPQNGQELLTENLEPDGSPARQYVDAIDGQGREDLFFGYQEDNLATPSEEVQWMLGFLDLAEAQDVEVMVTDYCWTTSKMDSSYSWNEGHGFLPFAADHRDLDNIPAYPVEPWRANSNEIGSLTEASNFLYLINDQAFSSIADFVAAISATEYDLLIVDLFCCGEQLTQTTVDQLSRKPGGAKRLVLCYMSIGEAEDYRWYWQPSWSTDAPSWLAEENPDWPGNYLVEYWDPAWQAIIYGSPEAYLDIILTAGFDGVYLDKIDSFESF